MRSVAALMPLGSACALSMTGDLTISASQYQWGNNACFTASNATDSTAVTFTAAGTSAASTRLIQIVTSGDCPTCPPILNSSTNSLLSGGPDSAGGVFKRPTAAYQPATTLASAFTSIDSMTLPSSVQCPTVSSSAATGLHYTGYAVGAGPAVDVNHCPLTANTAVTVNGTLVPSIGDGTSCTATLQPYCGYYNMAVTVGGTTTQNLPLMLLPQSAVQAAAGDVGGPGDATYLFVNSSLTVAATAYVECLISYNKYYIGCLQTKTPLPTTAYGTGTLGQTVVQGIYGVTLVFTGSRAGTLTIAAGAHVSLSAPGHNTFSSGLLNGIVLYRRLPAGTSDSTTGVAIADTSPGNIYLLGGSYFPTSIVTYNANTSTLTPLCATVIAGTLTLGPSSGSSEGTTKLGVYSCNIAYAKGAAFNTPMATVRAAQVVE